MPLIIQAWKGLKSNQHIVFSFLLASAAITLAFSSINIVLKGFLEEDTDIIPAWMPVVHSFFDLLSSAASAACYAIFLGLLGKELDKPVWKYGSTAESLKRFFLPWFIMFFGLVALIRMQEGIIRSGNGTETLLAIEMLILFMLLFSIPVGAGIMFSGRFQWSLLGVAITPFWQLFSFTWVVLLVKFGQYLLFQIMLVSIQFMPVQTPFAMAIINMPLTLLDMLAFAMCWEILKIHRSMDLDESI